MNFSTIKMLRKILSLAIVACMMVTLFTGCSKKKTPETIPSEPELTLPQATEPATEPAPTETEPVNENMATVLNQLKVRSSPSEEAPETGVLEVGDKVEVMQTQTSMGITWGYVLYNDGNDRGWVQMQFVEWKGSSNETDSPEGGNDNQPTDKPAGGNDTVLFKGTVAVNELNIRKSPSQNADKVGLLKSGARVEILEKNGDWGRIDQGWISLQHVKLDGGSSNNGGNTNNGGSSNVTGNGSSKVISRGIVTARELNVREGAGTDHDQVASLPYGTRVEILEKSGSWGRVKQGWISLGYVFIDGSNTDNKVGGVITGDGLNIRSGPGTNYDIVGSLNSGDEVTVLFKLKVGDTTWGNIKQGWISLAYVDLEGDDDGIHWGDDDDDGSDSSKVVARGIVTADDLHIRKSASADSDSVGKLAEGTRVSILEKDGDWGRISKGWISLDYVYIDGTGDGGVSGQVEAGLNVRSGPGTQYDIVGGLEEGEWVDILFTLNVDGTIWYNIKDGWVSAAYIRAAD